MNIEKQTLLLRYLVSSPDTYILCRKLIEPDYFDPTLRKSVTFITRYFDDFSALPSQEAIWAETKLDVEPIKDLSSDQVRYCCSEIEKFCRKQAVLKVIYESPAYIKDENYGELENLLKAALAISLERDTGLDYYEAPRDRLESALDEPDRRPTLIAAIDEALGGGMSDTEYMLFTGNSGTGKSIVLANMAVNYAKQGYDVLYISLELSEKLIAQRLDMMHTGISTVIWKSHWETIANKVEALGRERGKIHIKRMPVGTNSRDVRALLKDYEMKYKKVPKVLVIDYLDLMGANEKVDANNISLKDRLAAEQTREIIEDFKMIGFTASQQNRAGLDADTPSQGHIAGGITKINTVDWTFAIVNNPTMKAEGIIAFVPTKCRSSDGIGKHITCEWVQKSLTIRDLPAGHSQLNKASVPAAEPAPEQKGTPKKYSSFSRKELGMD